MYYITESRCCMPEINATLQMNSVPIDFYKTQSKVAMQELRNMRYYMYRKQKMAKVLSYE